MRTELEQRVRVAARTLAESVPVVAPSPAAVRARARARPDRPASRRWVPALAAAGVFGLVVAIAVLPGLLRSNSVTKPIMAGDSPVLPVTLAGPTPGTADYLRSPPGRVIAHYHVAHYAPDDLEIPEAWDEVLVGADGRTYRQAAEPDGVYGPLLSPDGSRLARGSGIVANLHTGEVVQHGQVIGTPMAWSPESRRLVIGMFGPNVDLAATGFSVLDVMTGTAVHVETGPHTPSGAAFSPDGEFLAVDVAGGEGAAGTTIGIYDVRGELVRTLTVPALTRLAGEGAAWSPDGSLLVLEPRFHDLPVRDLSFVDATGSGRSVPAPIRLPASQSVLLGWRSPTTMLVGMDDATRQGMNMIAELQLDGGAPRTVSRVAVAEGSRVSSIQLATGLVPGVEIRDAGPPLRGP